jgi:hypothetical protein
MAEAVGEQDLRAVRFTTSSFCSADGCVEVGRLADGRVAVRDRKHRTQPALIFTPDEWTAFLAGARAGEFD